MKRPEDGAPEEEREAFARWCALQVVGLWDSPPVVRRWLETGDDKLFGWASALVAFAVTENDKPPPALLSAAHALMRPARSDYAFGAALAADPTGMTVAMLAEEPSGGDS